MSEILRVETISQMVQAGGLKEPKHPLVYVIDIASFKIPADLQNVKITTGFYSIFLKDADCALQYGRNTYDFDRGVLSFFGPGQVTQTNTEAESSYGWALFFHPDLIRKSSLAKNIENYRFFSYEVHEALHLSKKEEDILNDCIHKIDFELNQNIDAHSQQLLISNIELLLNYCNRFYERQFHTRTNHHKDIITKIEDEIKLYFDSNLQLEMGLPTTRYIAEKVNLSSNYLGDLLKKETGKNAKEHINDYVVSLAKINLLNSELNIGEIAYQLGFNYPHYFSRLFKQKTGLTPQEYRESK